MPTKKSAWNRVAANQDDKTSQKASAPAGPRNPQQGKGTGSPVTAAVTNYREIQENEVEVLRSIYMEDFEDVAAKPGAWNKSAETSFNLHLKAPSNPDVGLVLCVRFPTTYPKTLPVLNLEGLGSLKESTVDQVRSLLASKPKCLLGSEMIFELGSTIQDMLEDDAQARAQAAEKAMPSLEEERMVREATASRLAEEQKEELARKKEADAAEEDRVLSQLVQEEVKRRQEKAQLMRKSSMDQNEKVAEKSLDQLDAIVFDQPMTIKAEKGRSATFRAVLCKTLISKRLTSEVSTVKPIVSDNGSSAPLLVLREIVLEAGNMDESHFREKLRSSEEKLNSLKSLRHPNIVDFLGFKIYRPLENGMSGPWSVSLIVEYANKGSLAEFLEMVESVAVANIRAWTIQLLEALNYYHRHGIVHENIHCGNVMLFRPNNGSTIVKLSDGFYRTLPCSSRGVKFASSKSPSWLPPELGQEPSRRTNQTDVWDLGVVFLQMAFGKEVLLRYTSPTALISSQDLSESFEFMIRRFFRVDPKKRPSAFDLLPSEFLRDDSPIVVSPTVSHSLASSRPSRVRHDSANMVGSLSRYANDFVEAGRLGKGGYGEVVKARNKLDGQFYAIKKIPQLSNSTDTLQEIMLLSQLNHPYVVRYFTAWLEQDCSTVEDDDSDEAITSTDDVSTTSLKERVNFDFSASGLDFISSSGYPKIEFGYDSNEENEGEGSDSEDEEKLEDEDMDEPGSQHVRRSYSQASPLRSILYIQMEYCEKHTLRDLIRNQLSNNTEEVWRLFRQILDGLAHIHKHHIIHRDLKPDNIFIDVGSNPRIGDFGLATTGQFSTATKSSAVPDSGDNMTRSIGTTFYVAPELKSAAVGQYNEKVDMYSLGIIFFEMCYPLKTGMERDSVLRAIRERDPSLPEAFQSPEKTSQRDIILSLLQHKPSDRPNSAELLQSGRLPLYVEDDILRKALLGISDSNSPQYHKILSTLFSQPSRKVQQAAWDRENQSPNDLTDVILASLVKDKLNSIFRRHGAVESKRQLVFPRSDHYTGNVFKLLDSSGTVLQLPYDFTLPNARSVARGDFPADKSFIYGTVYRELQQGGEPPKHGEVDFDISSFNASDLALKEAEVIKVLDEITLEFPPLKVSQMCFHLNHSDLLGLIMDFCHIDMPQRPTVEEIISTLNVGHWTWPKIRNKLRSPLISIPSTAVDDLARFDFRDTIDKAHQRLQSIFEGSPYVERLTPVFTHLNAVTTYLKRMKVKRKVYINPLSSYNNKFYKGNILFQCLFDAKRRDVFAAGGRYDRLVQEVSRTSSTGRQGHAVGFNLKFDSLCGSMSNFVKNTGKSFLKQTDVESQGPWKTRKCDVLVGSFDAAMLRTTGIEILRELWANDIGAELAGDPAYLEDLLSGTKDDGHSWIVNVRHDANAVAERSLRVKSIVKDEDFDIRASELVSWLKVEMRDRARREGTHDTTKLFRSVSHQDGPSIDDRDVDVRILSSQHRGKKTNRRNVIENAQLRSQELVRTFLDGPIAAIETKDDILDAIRDTRLSDPESWRRMIQNAPAAERAYLGQVHELLLDLAKSCSTRHRSRNAFVFNFRTGSCIYYDLGGKI